MELKAELTAQLSAGPLVAQLFANLTAPAGDLHAVAPAAGTAEISAATSGASGLSLSGVGAAAGQLAEQVTPLLAALPGVDGVLAPLTALLGLVRTIGPDLPGQIRALADRLAAELSGSSEGGFLAALVRVAEALADAPEGKALRELLLAVIHASGADVPADALSFPNAVPAAAATVQAVGGLMALESVLAEADRLTGIMAAQLDPATIQPAVDATLAAFGGSGGSGGGGAGDPATSLAAFVARLDPDQPAEVDAAVAAIAAAAARLGALRDLLANGMGFGEATLVYLDVDRVQAELETAATMVRSADPGPIERAARAIAERAAPFLAFDSGDLPSFDLPGLLAALEGKVEDFANQIRTLDASAASAPIAAGLGSVTAVLSGVSDLIARATAALRSALDAVRQAVAALPVGTIANAIRDALAPVSAVLDSLRQLIAGIAATLHDAVAQATAALTAIEGVVDQFKHDVEAFFGIAKATVDGLRIDQVTATVAAGIQGFDDVLAKARMAPYFDTAKGAIDSAAGVISAVPFGLLPDSMKADVEAALAPIRAADADAVPPQIERLLGISGGSFDLTPLLRQSIHDVEQSYRELLAAVAEQDPRLLVAQIDGELAAVVQKIHDLSPSLTLAPLQAAIDQVKGTVAGFDLRQVLAPVDAAFAQILAALDRFSPATLFAPLEAEVQTAREKVVSAIHLAEWGPAIDGLMAQADALLARVDPAVLEPALRSALAEAQELLDRLPDLNVFAGFGNLAALLLSGSGLRVYPWTFPVVLGWLGSPAAGSTATGSADLLARSGRIADAVTRTRDAVAAVDLTALAGRLDAQVQALRSALAGHPGLPAGSAVRLRLEGASVRLDVAATFAPLAVNRDRYLAALERSAALGETLRRIGLSEVDATIARLRTAFAPLAALADFLRGLARRLGLPGLEEGLVPALQNLLAVATPERLTGIILPLFAALKERIDTLLQAVVAPVRAAIDELVFLLGQIDLAPLSGAADGIYQEVRAQIVSLSPSGLLAGPLASFDALQAEVAAFDPLQDLLAIADALRAAIERILGKLKASEILASPLAIYDHILAELGKLDVEALFAPVLAQLDDLAGEVDGGLTETVAAFKRLQQSLPSGDGGGGAVGATGGALLGSASVGIGF